MGHRHITNSVALVFSAVITAPALAQEAHSTSRSCSPVLESQVCTWVVMEGGVAVELGVTFPIAVVEAVPSDAEMVWPPEELATVLLPAEARTSLGIDHLGINWEAHGHPPARFLTPHFDFHFYNLSPSEIRAIDCSDGHQTAEAPGPAHTSGYRCSRIGRTRRPVCSENGDACDGPRRAGGDRSIPGQCHGGLLRW